MPHPSQRIKAQASADAASSAPVSGKSLSHLGQLLYEALNCDWWKETNGWGQCKAQNKLCCDQRTEGRSQ